MIRTCPSIRWLYSPDHYDEKNGNHVNSKLFQAGEPVDENWFDSPDFILSKKMQLWDEYTGPTTISVDTDNLEALKQAYEIALAKRTEELGAPVEGADPNLTTDSPELAQASPAPTSKTNKLINPTTPASTTDNEPKEKNWWLMKKPELVAFLLEKFGTDFSGVEWTDIQKEAARLLGGKP